MGKFVDLSNQTIGKWYVCNRVQDKIYPNGRRTLQYLCKCECGTQRIVCAENLRNHKTLSCGCYQKQIAKLVNKKSNAFEIEDNVCKIYTSDNTEILIDAEDYEKVKDYCWCISKGKKWEYAMTRIDNKTILLHRLIMDPQSDMLVDHINGNTLDNRKSNLRICTNQQNCFNHTVSCNNSSGYTGVAWHRLANKWQVYIRFNKKTLYLGLFENIDDAVAVRKQAEKQYFGEYARGEKVI